MRNSSADDSLEILEDEGLVTLARVHGRNDRGILIARLSDFGFERYLSAYLDGYEALVRNVGLDLLNSVGGQKSADQVARKLDAPAAAVRHIVRRFRERNLIHGIAVNDGNIIVVETRPRLRRWLEETEG